MCGCEGCFQLSADVVDGTDKNDVTLFRQPFSLEGQGAIRYSLSATYPSCPTTLTPQSSCYLQFFTMVNQATRVVYKPDPNSTDEFIAIVKPGEVRPFPATMHLQISHTPFLSDSTRSGKKAVRLSPTIQIPHG